jgi:N6-L-threonylcarbamoyladenine synthase
VATLRILGIETSCDETGIGIVEQGRHVLSNSVVSSLQQHRPYGGVIPEIAARAHVEALWEVMALALEEAQLRPEELDAIAVTQGPGLPGALHIGMAFAKGLALALERPLIPVDHLAAHLYAGQMTEPDLEPPFVGLVVSGGHTLLSVVHPDARFELLGETKDDAVGEAFDKVAKVLGLGYPGGPVIDRLAEHGRVDKKLFPRAQTKGAFDFSFSGLKTAVYQYVQRLGSAGLSAGGAPQLTEAQVADVAASFQETAVETLVAKTLKVAQRTGLRTLVIGGGVACNRRLRARFAEEAAAHKLRAVFPPPALCVDNGAMVAGLGFALLKLGRVAALSISSDPGMCLVS